MFHVPRQLEGGSIEFVADACLAASTSQRHTGGKRHDFAPRNLVGVVQIVVFHPPCAAQLELRVVACLLLIPPASSNALTPQMLLQRRKHGAISDFGQSQRGMRAKSGGRATSPMLGASKAIVFELLSFAPQSLLLRVQLVGASSVLTRGF
jgi:hypothetical protein